VNDKLVQEIERLKREIERLTSQDGVGIWKAYTPTFTGFSSDPTSVRARYCLVGKLCHVSIYASGNGTSNATTFQITAPFTAATVSGMIWRNSLSFYNIGATTYRGLGYVQIASGNDYFALFQEDGVWADSGNKKADFQLFYEVE
jgi:hypothetical protein